MTSRKSELLYSLKLRNIHWISLCWNLQNLFLLLIFPVPAVSELVWDDLREAILIKWIVFPLCLPISSIKLPALQLNLFLILNSEEIKHSHNHEYWNNLQVCLTIYDAFMKFFFLLILPLMLAHVYNSLWLLVLKCLGFYIVESVNCIHSLWVEFKKKSTIFLFALCAVFPICYCLPSFQLFKTRLQV